MLKREEAVQVLINPERESREKRERTPCNVQGVLRRPTRVSLGRSRPAVAAGLLVCLFSFGCQEPHNIRMTCAAHVPSSPEMLAGVDADGRVMLFDPKTQNETRVLGAHGAKVRSLRVSPDGRYLATVGEDARCRIWPIDHSQKPFIINPDRVGKDSGAIAFSADGRLLACGGAGSVGIYALPDGTRVRTIPEAGKPILYEGGDFAPLAERFKEARILSLDFKPIGHRLLIGTDIGVFEFDYLRSEMTWRNERVAGPATLVRYAPNGSDLIVASDQIDYFSNYRPKFKIAAAGQTALGRNRSISCSTFTPDGGHLAILDADGALSVVRLNDQERILKSNPGKMDPNGLAISGDGRTAWVGSQGNVERFTQITMPRATSSGQFALE